MKNPLKLNKESIRMLRLSQRHNISLLENEEKDLIDFGLIKPTGDTFKAIEIGTVSFSGNKMSISNPTGMKKYTDYTITEAGRNYLKLCKRFWIF